jgi:homoserine dehydrogenase
MSVVKVALLGFGTVGEGVYRTIQSHQKELKASLGKNVEIVAVLIKNKGKIRSIDQNVLITTDFDEILRIPHLDIVMEAIVEREPCYSYLQKAIRRGCHVITANKEMFAHHGEELLRLAEKEHVTVGFEASVAGGIPIIQTLEKLLNVNRIQKVEGILNGTSNFILTEMREKNKSFQEALVVAQEKGYAEADPTNDIEGIDSFYKLMILSNVAYGKQPEWGSVDIEGISNLTASQIAEADKVGLRFKHVATIRRNQNGSLVGSVKPVLVSHKHPFYHIEGVENVVTITTDIVGSITLQGPGAGMFPTASAMIEDVVHTIRWNKSESELQLSSKVKTTTLI